MIKKIIKKKSLGQNFLRDKGILQKIADFAQIDKEDVVVEVGPGEGSLTEFLLEKAKKVIAIEKDERMVEFLKEKFKKEIEKEKLEVIEGDILNLQDFYQVSEYILVGNIPYYITGALFKKFLENPPAGGPPKSITFVVQKEVAERIMAKDGKESILSISVKVYGQPEYGDIIKAGSFNPKPKVDSAIISIREISKENFKGVSEKKFFEILKTGFAHKRKMLIRNLEKVSKAAFDTPRLKEIFEKCGISEKARAENLSVENWVCLTKELI